MDRFAAFRYRDFRLFWVSLFLSNIGSWMQMTATSWLLYQITGSPLLLGVNGLFRAAPALSVGLISGVIADRFDRKKLLLTTQSTLCILALILGLLDHSDQIQPWHIYTVTFFSALVGSCGVTRIAPPVVFRPNNVPCGPFRTSTFCRSKKVPGPAPSPEVTELPPRGATTSAK